MENEHKWEREAGGEERCINPGCVVRRTATRYTPGWSWQRKKRAQWREEAHMPIPPCGGKKEDT